MVIFDWCKLKICKKIRKIIYVVNVIQANYIVCVIFIMVVNNWNSTFKTKMQLLYKLFINSWVVLQYTLGIIGYLYTMCALNLID